MKLSSFFYLLIVATLYSCSSKPLQFVALTQFNKVDSTLTKGNKLTMKYSVFIVENYIDNESSLVSIDSFVNETIDSNYAKYETYKFVFYKSSDITNVEHLNTDPKDLDRHSQQHDRIFTYTWWAGTFLAREKIKNGNIVNSKSNITIL